MREKEMFIGIWYLGRRLWYLVFGMVYLVLVSEKGSVQKRRAEKEMFMGIWYFRWRIWYLDVKKRLWKKARRKRDVHWRQSDESIQVN